jgi:hypothetical protein
VFGNLWNDDRTLAQGAVIVLSEGCEIDKAPTVLVADVQPGLHTDATLLGNIISGRVWRALYLDLSEPGWVDLRTIRPVPTSALLAKLDQRIASMTDFGRRALAGRIFSFLTHTLPPGARYFRDQSGVIWDAWVVTAKHLRQIESQFRSKIPAHLANGWLYLTSSVGTRRLVDYPIGWQFLTDEQLSQLTSRAQSVDPRDAISLAADHAARPDAK